MIPITHRDCGGVAFLYDHIPAVNEPIRASKAQHVDGSPVHPHDVIICDHCGKPAGLGGYYYLENTQP